MAAGAPWPGPVRPISEWAAAMRWNADVECSAGGRPGGRLGGKEEKREGGRLEDVSRNS